MQSLTFCTLFTNYTVLASNWRRKKLLTLRPSNAFLTAPGSYLVFCKGGALHPGLSWLGSGLNSFHLQRVSALGRTYKKDDFHISLNYSCFYFLPPDCCLPSPRLSPRLPSPPSLRFLVAFPWGSTYAVSKTTLLKGAHFLIPKSYVLYNF